MEWTAVLKSAFALLFVIGLILLASHLLKKYGNGRLMTRVPKTAAKRIGVVEVAMVDGRRRLVLVRRDDVEHLLLISPETQIVVETNIHPAAGKTWKVGE